VVTDDNPHIRASGEAFGWVEEDRWAKGPAVYLMVAAIIGAMTGGVVIVLAGLR
jgi:hypothetical protein